MLKCDADAKRPTAPGQSCWVTLRKKDGATAKRYITAQREAGVIVAASADDGTLDVRLDRDGKVVEPDVGDVKAGKDTVR